MTAVRDPARFLLQVSDDGCRVDLWCLDCPTGDSYLLVVSTMNSSLGRFNWHCVEHERGYHAPLGATAILARMPVAADVASGSADPCPPSALARPRLADLPTRRERERGPA